MKTRSGTKTRKNIKKTLMDVHREGMENARNLAGDGGGESDAQSKEVARQLESVAADNDVAMASKTEYAIGGYVIGATQGAARAITGKEHVMIAYPTFTALVGLIPFFGPMIVAMADVQSLKFALLSFVDLGMFFFFPVYPLYMIFKFVDTRAIFKRANQGRKVREWEWFWNRAQ
jgi:hypothetical protein